MENDLREEKVEQPKKKKNGLFTLFACIMTGVIVFLATNLGQKASKVVEPDTGSNCPKEETTITSNEDSNSNEISNSNSNEASNVTSNEVSNVTSNTVSNVTENKQNYTVPFDGAFKNSSNGIIFALNSGIYLQVIGECDAQYGSYTVENDTIHFSPIIHTTCDPDLFRFNDAPIDAKIISDNEIQVSGKSYKITQYNSDVHADFEQFLEDQLKKSDD